MGHRCPRVDPVKIHIDKHDDKHDELTQLCSSSPTLLSRQLAVQEEQQQQQQQQQQQLLQQQSGPATQLGNNMSMGNSLVSHATGSMGVGAVPELWTHSHTGQPVITVLAGFNGDFEVATTGDTNSRSVSHLQFLKVVFVFLNLGLTLLFQYYSKYVSHCNTATSHSFQPLSLPSHHIKLVIYVHCQLII